MSSRGLLSYYYERRGGAQKELLSEHVEGGLAALEELGVSRLGLYAAQLGFGRFTELSRLAVILHDIGKAFYQWNIRSLEDTRYLSFQGHEWLSAYVTKRFFQEMVRTLGSENVYTTEEEDAVFFAVLYHHHALEVKSRRRGLEQVANRLGRKLSKDPGLAMSIRRDVEGLKTLAGTLASPHRDIFAEVVDRVAGEFSRHREKYLGLVLSDAEERERLVWRRIQGNIRLKRLSYILLNVLVAADYMAARKRGGSRSVFYRSIYEFWRLYMRRG